VHNCVDHDLAQRLQRILPALLSLWFIRDEIGFVDMLLNEGHHPFHLGKEIRFEPGAVLDQGGRLEPNQLNGGEARLFGREKQECSPRDTVITQELELTQHG
jgi:hypothetical protein